MPRFRTILCVCLQLFPIAAWAAEPAASSEADQAAVVSGNNAFAIELYGQLCNQSGNLVFSPESISTALVMADALPSGDIAAEMVKTQHFTLPPERLHPAMGALLRDLNAPHDGYQLKVANALWVPPGSQFLDTFLKLMKDNYGDVVHEVKGNSTVEVNVAINRWAAQQTANKIRELIPTRPARLMLWPVLTSVAYFKGDWQTQFDKAQTRDDEFHVPLAEAVEVPLMHRTGDFNYFDGGTFQAIEIPYKGRELSMIVFLPNVVDGLSAFEQSLTEAKVQQWLSQSRPAQNVIVTLPRFKLTQQFDLNGALDRIGIRLNMNLSEMIGENVTLNPQIYHEAYVDVNEEGTEAAAATGIEDHFPAAYRPPIVFRADHPFVFLIQDNRSGTILFMGRVTDPSQ